MNDTQEVLNQCAEIMANRFGITVEATVDSIVNGIRHMTPAAINESNLKNGTKIAARKSTSSIPNMAKYQFVYSLSGGNAARVRPFSRPNFLPKAFTLMEITTTGAASPGVKVYQ